jgi:predicted HicB family RNase H-like nuclease
MNTMKYMGYTARMDYDAEDNILVGKVLGIEDSLSFTPSPSVSSKPHSKQPLMTISWRARAEKQKPESRPAAA